MGPPARQRIGVLAAALWWGSLTALGFVVVPLLFTHLATPAAAGAMAARLFSAQTWISTGCAMLVLMAFNQPGAAASAPAPWVRSLMKWIVAGLLLALLVEFGVAPRIVSARSEGGNLRLWHGLGTAMYFMQWLCAGFALWRLTSLSGLQPPDSSAG
jgi:hypothetical protein